MYALYEVCSDIAKEIFNAVLLQNFSCNVFYRYFANYHYFTQFESELIHFVKYDDSDSDSNNITYLLCDVSRS